MKLLTLETTDSLYHPSGVMLEGYGRKYDFNYDNYQVDPRPSVLILGHWRHPRTRNQLVAGVNLNYLTDVEIEQLRRTLPQILKSRNLKDRYWAGRQLLPSVFNDNYRTYDKKFVHAVTPGTLRFWSKKAEAEKQKKQGEVAKQKELAALARARVPEIEPEPEPAVEPDEPEVSPEPEEKPKKRRRRRIPGEPPEVPEPEAELKRVRGEPEEPEEEPEEEGPEESFARMIDTILERMA